MTQKGFTLALVLIGILILILAGNGAYYLWKKDSGSSLPENTTAKFISVQKLSPQQSIHQSSTSSEQFAEIDWNIYLDNKLGISYEFPLSWKRGVNGLTGENCQNANCINYYVQFYTEDIDNSDVLSFIKEYYPGGATTYKELNISDFNNINGIKFKKVISQFNIFSDYFTFYKNKIYIIASSASQEPSDNETKMFLDIFERIINSFKFID